MDVVFLDVRYSPFRILRGGKWVYPAQIAFLDSATNRLHQTLFPLASGERATSEQVFSAFCAMIRDPQWGLPIDLYHDGGGENAPLTTRIAAACASHPDTEYRCIRVRPHSPQSKPIEGMFAVFDRCCLALIRGFPGFKSKPLRKRALKDRETISYPGTWESFVEEVQGVAILFNTAPIHGRASRQGRYDAAVAKGHRSRVGDLQIRAIGSQLVARRNDHGSVRIKGERFTGDPLYSADPTASVLIAVDPTRAHPPVLVSGSTAVALCPDPPLPQTTGPERRAAYQESERRKTVRDEQLDEWQRKLAPCLSLRDRIRAANENGLIPPASSGIVDGTVDIGGTRPTTMQKLAALRSRTSRGRGRS
jgi:hypothetical protein